MNSKILLVIALLALAVAEGDESIRSPKKGLVVSGWAPSNFLCGDFQAFKTASWYYNYFTNRDFFFRRFGKQWCECLDDTAENGKSPPSDEERDALCFGGSEEMEFVPMIWKPDGWEEGHRGFDDSNLTESDTIFLSFNEP